MTTLRTRWWRQGCAQIPVPEAVVFPFLNKKLDFSTEAKQHLVIHAALDGLLDYIRSARADTSNFDAGHLKGLMQSLQVPLVSPPFSSESLFLTDGPS